MTDAATTGGDGGAKSDESVERPQFSLFGTQLASEGMMVDFLGGLVPGIVFLVGATIALVLPVVSLHAALAGHAPPALHDQLEFVARAVRDTPSTLWLGVFSGLIVFSYMVGHIFYRHDVKEADRSSFRRLVMEKWNEDNASEWPVWRKAAWSRLGVDVFAIVPGLRPRYSVDTDWLEKNLGCSSENDCEFPYEHYNRYLEQRGVGHLLPLVMQGRDRRSKNYVNLLKVRLHYHAPRKVRAIIKNEAHVRLAASTWYVAKLLCIIGMCGFTLTVLSLAFTRADESIYANLGERLGANLFALLAPVTIVAAAVYAWWTIRGFLHYQRMREVFFVLETAFTAFRGREWLLDPPFKVRNVGETARRATEPGG